MADAESGQIVRWAEETDVGTGGFAQSVVHGGAAVGEFADPKHGVEPEQYGGDKVADHAGVHYEPRFERC